MITNPLTVDEGGESSLGPEHLLLSDVDSMEENLRVELQREPQHGALQRGGRPVKAGQTFTVQDLRNLKVRSEIPLLMGLKGKIILIVDTEVIFAEVLCWSKNKTSFLHSLQWKKVGLSNSLGLTIHRVTTWLQQRRAPAFSKSRRSMQQRCQITF